MHSLAKAGGYGNPLSLKFEGVEGRFGHSLPKKLVDFAAFALGRSSCAFGTLEQWISLLDLVCFGRLRRGMVYQIITYDFCRDPLLKKGLYFYIEFSLSAVHLVAVAELDLVGRLDALAVYLHVAATARSASERAGFEDTGRPQPLVNARAFLVPRFDVFQILIGLDYDSQPSNTLVSSLFSSRWATAMQCSSSKECRGACERN